MSNRDNKSSQEDRRTAALVFDLALTMAAGAFVFFTFSGLLQAYAP
jgi:hypothetical protein